MSEYTGPERRENDQQLERLERVVEDLVKAQADTSKDIAVLTTTLNTVVKTIGTHSEQLAKFTKMMFMIMGGATTLTFLGGVAYAIAKLFF